MEKSNSVLNYHVPAMSCAHCVAAITEEVGRVDGVDGVSIDLETKAVVVTGRHLSDPAVRSAIVEAGFEAAP